MGCRGFHCRGKLFELHCAVQSLLIQKQLYVIWAISFPIKDTVAFMLIILWANQWIESFYSNRLLKSHLLYAGRALVQPQAPNRRGKEWLLCFKEGRRTEALSVVIPVNIICALKSCGNVWELCIVGMMSILLCPMAKFPLRTLLLN